MKTDGIWLDSYSEFLTNGDKNEASPTKNISFELFFIRVLYNKEMLTAKPKGKRPHGRLEAVIWAQWIQRNMVVIVLLLLKGLILSHV